MEQIYSRSQGLSDVVSSFCPGCLHGLCTKLVAEVLEELQVLDETIGVMSVGCGALVKRVIDIDLVCSNHGRAPAVASAISRCKPDSVVFTYQGDGDLAAIGLSEILCAANRGENFVVIFVNNSTYGMTGGQMAPTTLVGQKTTTTPAGRNPEKEGYPMKMCELIAQFEAPRFVARYAIDTPASVLKAKAAIRKAFEIQRRKEGFTFIELLSNCPTNWGMTPVKTLDYIREHTMKAFPQGIFCDVAGGSGDGK